MDPICHTLVGAALAESGLKRRTALGTATLLVGANLPDVDALSLLWGPGTGLWFRRGVTHGVFGVAVLPFVLTGALILWHHVRPPRWQTAPQAALHPRHLLFLSFVAVLTHPLLDFLNVYGMRWLMPLSDTWYYADALFIVDPWVWGILAAGVFVARHREKLQRTTNPDHTARYRAGAVAARISLLAVAAYILVMAASNIAARGIVARSVERQGITPVRMMVAPVAVNPFTRWVVVEVGDVYHFGILRWLSRPMFELYGIRYQKFPSHPAAAAATRGPAPRKFLSWARFPYNHVEDRGDEYLVYIGDARYTLDPKASWGAMCVTIGKR